MHYEQGSLHRVKNNLNLRMKAEPVAVGADATIYVWFLSQIYVVKYMQYLHKSQTYSCSHSGLDWPGFQAEIQNIFGTVWRRFRLFLGQCGQENFSEIHDCPDWYASPHTPPGHPQGNWTIVPGRTSFRIGGKLLYSRSGFYIRERNIFV